MPLARRSKTSDTVKRVPMSNGFPLRIDGSEVMKFCHAIDIAYQAAPAAQYLGTGGNLTALPVNRPQLTAVAAPKDHRPAKLETTISAFLSV